MFFSQIFFHLKQKIGTLWLCEIAAVTKKCTALRKSTVYVLSVVYEQNFYPTLDAAVCD